MKKLFTLVVMLVLPAVAFATSFTTYKAPNGKYIQARLVNTRLVGTNGTTQPDGVYINTWDGTGIRVQKGNVTEVMRASKVSKLYGFKPQPQARQRRHFQTPFTKRTAHNTGKKQTRS